MTTIGFLHTSPSHVPRFAAIVTELAPEAEVITVVDEVLLDRARSHGLADLTLIGGVADRLAQLVDADVVVCTCSTIGDLAEDVGLAAGVSVQRVDRAMAEQAVTIGGRVAVIVAVESTAGPTTDLLEEVAVATGAAIEIDVIVVPDAWRLFEVGDTEGYESAIAEAVIRCHTGANVVVLAQASMAGVIERSEIESVETPVLASPRAGLVAALAVRR